MGQPTVVPPACLLSDPGSIVSWNTRGYAEFSTALDPSRPEFPPGNSMISRQKRKRVSNSRRRTLRFRITIPALVWSQTGARSDALRLRTKNLSRKGVYFHGESPLEVGSLVNFELPLPLPCGGGAGGLLTGSGRLLRCEMRRNKQIGFAASIDWYELRPLPKSATERSPA